MIVTSASTVKREGSSPAKNFLKITVESREEDHFSRLSRTVHPPRSLFSSVGKFYQRDIFGERYILTGYRRARAPLSLPLPLFPPLLAVSPHAPFLHVFLTKRLRESEMESTRISDISATRLTQFDKSLRYGHKVSLACRFASHPLQNCKKGGRNRERERFFFIRAPRFHTSLSSRPFSGDLQVTRVHLSHPLILAFTSAPS